MSLYPCREWWPVIISRSGALPAWAGLLPASSLEIRKVDYSSQSSLVSALEGCHTVISVILAKDGTQSSSQIALLQAAVKAGCKRFAPSEWACGPAGVSKVSLLNMAKPSVWDACERSGIEWARFNVGLFMNYLGVGCAITVKGDPETANTKEDDICAGVDREGDMADGSGSFLFSLSSATAELPMKADGVSFPRITVSEINNIGEFVAASLSLEKWEKDMNIAGCTIRLDKLLNIAERVLNRPFQVKKLTRQQLEEEIIGLGELDFMKRMWLELKLICSDDEVGESVLEPVVNGICPEIKALDVETYLRRSWGD